MSVLTIHQMLDESGLSRPTLYRVLKGAGLEPQGSILQTVTRIRRGIEEAITCPFSTYPALLFRAAIARFKDQRSSMVSPPGLITAAAAEKRFERFGVTKSILQQWEKDCPGRERGLDVAFEDAVVIIERGGKEIRQHWRDAKHYRLSQVKEGVNAWCKMPRVRGDAQKLRRRGKGSARKPRRYPALGSVKSEQGEVFQQIKPMVVEDKHGVLWATQTAAFVDHHLNDQALRHWAAKGWVGTVRIERRGFGRFPFSTYYRRTGPQGYLALQALQRGKNRNVPANAVGQTEDSRVHQSELTDMQAEFLDGLYQYRAFDLQHRVDISDMANKRGLNPGTMRKAVRRLKEIGFVESKEGRGGGCWLTADGREFVEKYRL